jgi:hypothetical protein
VCAVRAALEMIEMVEMFNLALGAVPFKGKAMRVQVHAVTTPSSSAGAA